MEDLLKKQQKILFSGAGASHQNRTAERTTNMMVTVASDILIQS